jgi:UrcA family protein
MKTIVCTLLAAAAVFGASASEARDREDAIVAARIVYGDLDLSKPEGRMALDRRINAAAGELCPVHSVTDPRAQAKHRACRAQVRESADEKLAVVLERYAARGESPSAN